jgi:hypothetical protein
VLNHVFVLSTFNDASDVSPITSVVLNGYTGESLMPEMDPSARKAYELLGVGGPGDGELTWPRQTLAALNRPSVDPPAHWAVRARPSDRCCAPSFVPVCYIFMCVCGGAVDHESVTLAWLASAHGGGCSFVVLARDGDTHDPVASSESPTQCVATVFFAAPPHSFRVTSTDPSCPPLAFTCGDNFAVGRWLNAMDKVSAVCANPRGEGNVDAEAIRKLGTVHVLCRHGPLRDPHASLHA